MHPAGPGILAFHVISVFVLATQVPCSFGSTIIAWGDPTNLQTNIPPDLTNAVAIGAGSGYGLALLNDSTVRSWGNDYSGAGPVPPGVSNITGIACGLHHVLALTTNGTVTAWKYFFDEYGQATVPTNLSQVTAIAAGAYHSLALKSDGTVVAWGSNSSFQTNVPPGLSNIVALAAGGDHSLTLRRDGTLAYWGARPGSDGYQASLLSNVVAIAAGFYHNLALFRDGTVFAWGLNTAGQTNVPPGLSNVVAIACGGYHSLALRSDGSLISWGHNAYGQTTVPAGLTNIYTFAGGDFFSAVLMGNDPLHFIRHPTSISAIAGDYVQFRANAAGIQPISWQWYSNSISLAGETNSWLMLTNVLPSQAASYYATASNSLGPTQSLSAALMVLPLLISQQPSNQTVYGGDVAGFQVQARNLGPFFYQWYFNGTSIDAASNSSLVLPNVSTNDSGAISVTVSNFLGSVTSSNATLTVVPITLLAQPTNSTIYSGRNAFFSVVAWKNGPFSYQWRFNGANLTDMTNSSLSLTNVGTNAAGLYSVLVKNPSGSIESSNAILSVVESTPIITSHPTNYFSWFLGDAFFQISATGSAPLSYQWQFNQQDIPGATNSSLLLKKVGFENQGSYSAILSNSFGPASSSNTFLTVVPVTRWGTNLPAAPPPQLTNVVGLSASYHGLFLLGSGKLFLHGNMECPSAIPAALSNVVEISAGPLVDIVALSNGTAVAWGCSSFGLNTVPANLSNVLAVAAGGAHNLALKSDGTVVSWGSPGSGAVPPGLRSVVSIDAGNDFSLALKADGSLSSWGSSLYRQTHVPPNLTNIVAICCGDYHSLALKSDGTVVAWGAAGPSLPPNLVNAGQTNVPPGLSNIVAIGADFLTSFALKYDGTVVAWGQGNSGQTNPPIGLSNVWAVAARNSFCYGLVSTSRPAIARQPRSAVVAKGERAMFSIGVSSSDSVVYHWQHNGVDIPDATNSILIISSADSPDAGTYRVAVSNQFGSLLSRDASLAVGAAPAILVPPLNQAILSPGAVTFSVGATGSVPLAYQWKKSFSITGATNSSLSLSNLHRGNSGYYSVVISNLFGSATAEARLRVEEPQLLSGFNFTTSGALMFSSRDAFNGTLFTNDIPFFSIWTSTNLVDWEWLSDSVSLSVTNGALLIQVPNTSASPQRYYRVGEQLISRVQFPQSLSSPLLQPDGSRLLFSTDSIGLRLSAADLPRYKAYASTNLVSWDPINTTITLTNGILQILDPGAKNVPARFYRLQESN